VAVRGEGRTGVAAYGLADAEHRVEKEIRTLWPDAVVRIREVRRSGDENRIADEFDVRYRVEGSVEIDAPSSEEARRGAFRAARELLAGSRYWRVAWEEVRIGSVDAEPG